MQYPSGVLTIDLNAIQANWLQLRGQLTGGAECGAVVKADAYGLGMQPVARALHTVGCRSFFVVTLQEGVALRGALGAGPDIYLLHGVKPGDEPECVQHQLIPVLINNAMVQRWLAFCEQGSVPQVQRRSVLKINTGMNRLGLSLAEFQSLIDRPRVIGKLGCELLMSHLACAEDAEHPLSQQQLHAFTRALADIRQHNAQVRGSLANSAAILQGATWHFDLVRPGISLYGSNPLGERQDQMQPVVGLQLPVLQTRRIAVGDAIGYGATYIAQRELEIAALAAGYGDGIFRSLGNSGHAWFKRRLPIVGRVSMDSLTVDVTDLPETERPQEGDVVELLGTHIGIDAIAQAAGTVAYEVLTRLKGRYKRHYLFNGALLEDGITE